MISLYDNEHFFGEHLKFGANYALKEICHQIGGLDLKSGSIFDFAQRMVTIPAFRFVDQQN